MFKSLEMDVTLCMQKVLTEFAHHWTLLPFSDQGEELIQQTFTLTHSLSSGRQAVAPVTSTAHFLCTMTEWIRHC